MKISAQEGGKEVITDSGVGMAAIQLAKRAGATVLATVSSAAKLEEPISSSTPSAGARSRAARVELDHSLSREENLTVGIG